MPAASDDDQHDDQMPERPEGLAWSWDVDLDGLMAALDRTACRPDEPDGRDADQEAVLDELMAAQDEGRARALQAGEVAGRVAERLPAGPGLAAFLARVSAGQARYRDLPAVAAGYRRLAAWAQAGELAAVAQIAAHDAASDPHNTVDATGCPAIIGAGAAGEVALALVMSQYGAACWADLAVTLSWRLAATGRALAAGDIDLSRARLIAEATTVLDDDTARLVEDRVLPEAGTVTTGRLRALLRRAVIAADPEGAERRREQAETRARVGLYPDDQGTASLCGSSLPAVGAAAALARISAIARAWKASGAGGGADLLRAKVFLGLLLGTLPYIPPAEGAPPDPSPDNPPPGDTDPGDTDPGDTDPGDTGPGDSVPWSSEPDGHNSHDPGPGGQDAPPEDGPDGPGGDALPGDTGDNDEGQDEDEDRPGMIAPAWPAPPAAVPAAPAAFAASAMAGSARPPGLLDLTLPWATLTGATLGPGHLGRIGPITGPEARYLALLAAGPPAEWRVIITNPDGQAIATAPVPRTRAGPAPGVPRRYVPGRTGLVGRVTVIIPRDVLDTGPPPADHDSSGIIAAIWRAAARARAAAAARAEADRAAAGCAHILATLAYRPRPMLRNLVIARDRTCRFPRCRQPAWRGDLDHTTPFDHGGRTCACNLGGLCRTHHKIKQREGWILQQAWPGVFAWTTPAGRTYQATPDPYPA